MGKWKFAEEREWDKATDFYLCLGRPCVMPKTTSKDDVVNREDFFCVKIFSFIIFSFVTWENIHIYNNNNKKWCCSYYRNNTFYNGYACILISLQI